MLEWQETVHRSLLTDLCHLIQEDKIVAVMRKACTLFTELSGGQRAYLFEIDQTRQLFRLAAGIDRGDSNYAPPAAEVPLDIRKSPISPLTQAVIQGGPVILSRNFGGYDIEPLLNMVPHAKRFAVEPLKNDRGVIFALLISAGNEDQTKVRGDRFYLLVISAIGTLIDLRLRHQRATASSAALNASLTSLSKRRAQLEKQNEMRRMRLRGRSAAIIRARGDILKAAQDIKDVVVVGPRGSRREDVARDIHDVSSLLVGRFVYFDCRRPSDLAIPELVGFRRGAIPHIQTSRHGLLREASSGLLYFDNADACDEVLRGFLIRLLDAREFRAVGSERPIALNAKLVFGITHSGETAIDEPILGAVRYQIILPALSQRLEDYPDIVEAVVENISSEKGRTIEIGPDVVPYLASLNFRGDLREMNGLISRACELSHETAVLGIAQLKAALESSTLGEASKDTGQGLRDAVEGFEKDMIKIMLAKEKGNRQSAAKKLGIPKRTLADKCRRYGL